MAQYNKKMARNGLNGLKWLELNGMAEYGWKWLEIIWPY